MKIPFVIIGSGLSGIAAAIRYARFSPDVLLLERHSRIGGLNSYFYRNGALIETGLHAITNFSPPQNKKAPLNQLFRQLKLSRKQLPLREQIQSEICFVGERSLFFSNDFNQFKYEVTTKFPHSAKGFSEFLSAIKSINPFFLHGFQSAKKFLSTFINDSLLLDMISCPVMYYGSSRGEDMDLAQFIIIFRSIFEEGMFRPQGTIKDFLDLLLNHYKQMGGKIRLQAHVVKILSDNNKVSGVELDSGETIECDHLLSTIGYDETMKLIGREAPASSSSRIGFVESIFHLPQESRHNLLPNRTIIFYNDGKTFNFRRPNEIVDYQSGVICFSSHFQGPQTSNIFEIRSTHLANYHQWKSLESNPLEYKAHKEATAICSIETIEKIIGNFRQDIIYKDTFTPLTIERFTSKKEGAIYGRPEKIKDGNIGYDNLFLAGTDQGYLGIIGSMLSGVSIVNQHVLPAL